MRIIGLTGPTGAGKSTLCERFEALGIPCINTDDIYHSITSYPSPCVKELQTKFGDEIIDERGALDRVALAKLVFQGENTEENISSLNAITHKYVWNETNSILTQYQNRGKKLAVIDAPALFSSKIFVDACDLIISVICDKEIRIQRITKRDGISREKVLARMAAQPSDEFFIENSDYYIRSENGKENMIRQLDDIFEQEAINIK